MSRMRVEIIAERNQCSYLHQRLHKLRTRVLRMQLPDALIYERLIWRCCVTTLDIISGRSSLFGSISWCLIG